MNIVVVGIDFRGLLDQIDGLVTVAAKGIGKIIKARVKRIFLVLNRRKRVLRCSQALGRRSVGRGIGRRLCCIGRVVKLIIRILGGRKQRTVHRLPSARVPPTAHVPRRYLQAPAEP